MSGGEKMTDQIDHDADFERRWNANVESEGSAASQPSLIPDEVDQPDDGGANSRDAVYARTAKICWSVAIVSVIAIAGIAPIALTTLRPPATPTGFAALAPLHDEIQERIAQSVLDQLASEQRAIDARSISSSSEARAKVPASISDADIDRLTTYAVILGRAVGCGLSISSQGGRVGDWLVRRTSSKSEQSTYAVIYMQGIVDNRDAQRAGRSPDDCSTVNRQFAQVTWP